MNVAVDSGDEYVLIGIVVVLGDRDSHRVTFSSDGGLLGHIAERPVAVVAIEPVPELRRTLLHRGQFGAVYEVYVRPAVAVVIKRRHATGHGFDLIFSRTGVVAQDEIEP